MERRQAWVHPDQAKARRAIRVPQRCSDGRAERRRARVFTYEGEPIEQVNTNGWRKL